MALVRCKAHRKSSCSKLRCPGCVRLKLREGGASKVSFPKQPLLQPTHVMTILCISILICPRQEIRQKRTSGFDIAALMSRNAVAHNLVYRAENLQTFQTVQLELRKPDWKCKATQGHGSGSA